MKVMVAGGAGFIGSHLIDALLGRGDTVICVDNLFTGSLENIGHHVKNSRLHTIVQDITIPLSASVDAIVNLACPASPVHYKYDPVHTMMTNVLGTKNLLDLASDCNARFVQASTSEVYGDPAVTPQSESYHGDVNPIGPRACYDEGKRAAETLCFDYADRHNVDIRVARIFNTYGPRTAPADGRVVSNFVVAALKGQPITIHGTGQQTRSFCFIDDLIRGLLLMLDRDEPLHKPINLGNPNEMPVLDLANKILERARLNGYPVNGMTFEARTEDDPERRRPDISRAQLVLGWEPLVGLDDGLHMTMDYFAGLAQGGRL